MSFLQPWLLIALPLLAIPVIVHLLDRKKHTTVNWGAMMFLIEATQASRGWQKIRHWLILLARMLAVAGLILAVSRPIAGGWLGFAGGGPTDCVIVVVDRSSSMGVSGLRGGTKLTQGLESLAKAFENVEANHWVLLDSTTGVAQELDSPDDLLDLPIQTATAATSNLPSLLQAAVEYRKANSVGRTEIWILSDTQSDDWRSENSQWSGIRDQLAESNQVRVLLLAYPEASKQNASIRVTGVTSNTNDDGATLSIDLVLELADEDVRRTIPVEFALGSGRSVLDVPVTPGKTRVEGHQISLDGVESGWGRVSIPTDGNESDNSYYFTFGEEPARRTLVVAENQRLSSALRAVATSPRDPALTYEVEARDPAGAAEIDLSTVALILWQGPLPQGNLATDIQSFIHSGGRALFFPPLAPANETAFGARWIEWKDAPGAPAQIATWFEKDDLLGNTESGRALPLGELAMTRTCSLELEGTTLARLDTGTPFLVRAATEKGGVYFCSTLPTASSSNLLSNAIVFYVLVQRALEDSVDRLRAYRDQAPGTFDPGVEWKLASEPLPNVLSSEHHQHAGVFRRTLDEQGTEFVAINRRAQEDRSGVVPRADVEPLFEGLDFVRVDQGLQGRGSILDEVWRLFLIAMIAALVAEAGLCLLDVPGGRRSS